MRPQESASRLPAQSSTLWLKVAYTFGRVRAVNVKESRSCNPRSQHHLRLRHCVGMRSYCASGSRRRVCLCGDIGVYCRPACASRLPKRKHVRFFQTCSKSEQADFRPCKRCQPNAMAPSYYKAGAINVGIQFTIERSSLGWVLGAATAQAFARSTLAIHQKL
jgi:hypothetical protein